MRMHKIYGVSENNKCGDCCNLLYRNEQNVYFKCRVYGNSCATSTDWAKKWLACGLFGKEMPPNQGRCLTDEFKKEEIVFENQIQMF